MISYASLADLKAVLAVTDTNDDTALTLALSAVSRSIDAHCGRQFGVEAVALARYYGARHDVDRRRDVVLIDDLQTTDTLAVATDAVTEGTFDQTLTLDSDFRLTPDNAAADGEPWTLLVAAAGTGLPAGERRIKITAKWGWTAVPDLVAQATLLQASRVFKRKDAPFGIAGSPELGSEMRILARLDPDVAVLLSSMRRSWGIA